MVVYVEYVILNNLLANYAVMVLTAKFCGRSIKGIRRIIFLALATTMGVFTPLISVPDAVCSIIKICCSLLLVFILTGRIKLKRYLITLIIFYFSSFGVAGAVTAILSFTSFGVEGYSNEELTFCILLGSLIFSYIVKQATAYFRGRVDKGECEVEFAGIKGNTVLALAFTDSGNCVQYGETGVVFVKEKFRDKILCAPLNSLVKVQTICGTKYYEVYSVRMMTVKNTKEKRENFPVVFWEGNGNYDVILYGGDGNGSAIKNS